MLSKAFFKVNKGNVDRTVPFRALFQNLPLGIVSVAADILFRIMRLIILHVIDNKVMPRQLLQFPKSPFFGSLIIVHVFKSSGVSSSSQIVHLLSEFLRRP